MFFAWLLDCLGVGEESTFECVPSIKFLTLFHSGSLLHLKATMILLKNISHLKLIIPIIIKVTISKVELISGPHPYTYIYCR